MGDLDRDGNLDLVIPLYGGHYSGRDVQLYQGRGDGTFDVWPVDGNQDGVNDGMIRAAGAANPMFAGIADFNDDGRPDVVVSGNNGDWSVDILVQSADRGFAVSDSDRAGQNPQFFDLGDFNEDGYPDVVAGALYNGVLVFLNDADDKGTIHQEGGTYLSDHHHYVVVADFNGDGHEDIAVRGNQDTRVDILYGNGQGRFPTTARFSASGVDGYLAAADIDRDGDSDLVVASTSTRSVDLLLNDGSGRFAAPVSTALTAAPWGLAVADFDQDGWMDVVVARADDTVQVLWNRGGVSVTPATFSLAENSPASTRVGTVTATGTVPLTFAISAGNADPDGDTRLAFAIDAASGAIRVNDAGDLDYETTSRFDLSVTVTDAGGASDAATVRIDLTNVDEPGNDRPEIPDAAFALPERSPGGTAVGTVTATDIDAGDTLTYSITTDNADPNANGQAAFALDPTTGALTVNDPGDLDFETTPVFTLGVTVTDSGGLTDTAALRVSLTDVNERSGTAGDDALAGTVGNDVLDGLAGNDTLSGGAGDDTLNGGAGSDRIAEQGDVNFILTDTQLTGLGTDRLIGIERATLTGGAGANRLDAAAFTGSLVILEGQGGVDVLIGRAVGRDQVRAVGDADFALTNTRLTGLGTDTLTDIDAADLRGYSGDNRFDASGFTRGPVDIDGGGGSDTLLGGTGADRLRGGSGADTLTGGAGADRFRFVTVAEGADTITDFTSGTDHIQVVSANFAGLPVGRLAAARFLDSGNGPTTADAVFMYDPASGALTFDLDGNGAGAAVLIATLAGPKALVANDLQVVAA